MPNGFYKLKVDKITRETPDAVSIRLLVPPPLKGMFGYKAGQYLTLHSMIMVRMLGDLILYVAVHSKMKCQPWLLSKLKTVE